MVYKSDDETTGNADSEYDTYNTQELPSQSSDFLTAQPTEAEQINFLAEIKQLTKSPGFIWGCLLITVGVLGINLLDFTWLSILGLAFAATYITALWILVFAAFSDTAYPKLLTALSVFRVYAIVTMVLACIFFALTAFMGFLVAVGGGFLFGLIFVMYCGLAYILIKYYYWALLQVISSSKERIITSKYTPLKGAKSFLLISYISIAISGVLFATVAALGIYTIVNLSDATTISPPMNLFFNGSQIKFPATAETVINATNAGASAAVWGAAFLIIYCLGTLLCLRILKKFDIINKSNSTISS